MKTPPYQLSIFGLFAACTTFCSCDSGEELPKRPNIVVILADDIGYGDLSAYGSTTIHTPNVERLAASGIRFMNAHASAATSTPSRYSLLTGQYAFRRKDTGIARGNAYMIIQPDQYTLPAMLQEAGYTTGVVGKWHLGLGDENGQDWNGYMTPGPGQIGFDYSYIMAATGDRTPCVYFENQRIVNLDPNDPVEVSYTVPFPGEPLGRTHPELLTKLKPSHGHDMAIVNGISRIGYMRGGKSALWVDENIADSITHKAVSFIENNKDHPFFLYFGTNDIHVPRYPHPRFVGKSGMGPRGDAILEFDWSVGQILDVLERNGLTDNTLIILTSDNGPVVDDGYRDQAVELLGDHRPWGPLRGGKYSAFDAGTRVPFIVSWPAAKLAKGEDSPALISQVDMLATLASLTDQRLPKKSAPDSFDQLKAWIGKDPVGREYIMEQSNTLSVIKGEWKYIAPAKGAAYWPLTNTETGISQEPQLYNLSNDIGEQNNIASDYRDKVEELQKLIDWVKANPHTR
ncbi:MAG: arylsulfatase [Bacteroidales bacterium]|jgi:arylsulfatase A-like enzyme|nr:arylsulfatase [Bacteroidales bacterium]